MNNLEYWNKLKRPPSSALKKISGGRLSGKSDISPQWRYEIMTETFGACGIGWSYSIDKLWREDGENGIVFAFAQVSVKIKTGETWSEPIPGIGGSQLIERETKGLYDNDEAYKMAVTDALSVALKMIGVAADVYRGLWDGSKYIDKEDTPGKPPRKTGDEQLRADIKDALQSFAEVMGSQDEDGVGRFSDDEKLAAKEEILTVNGIITIGSLGFIQGVTKKYRDILAERMKKDRGPIPGYGETIDTVQREIF
jgi:hypothetical protein